MIMDKKKEERLLKAINNLYNSKQHRALREMVMKLQAEGEVLDNPSIERAIDETLITCGAWIYDSLNCGKKNMIKKIRKVLGYIYP